MQLPPPPPIPKGTQVNNNNNNNNNNTNSNSNSSLFKITINEETPKQGKHKFPVSRKQKFQLKDMLPPSLDIDEKSLNPKIIPKLKYNGLIESDIDNNNNNNNNNDNNNNNNNNKNENVGLFTKDENSTRDKWIEWYNNEWLVQWENKVRKITNNNNIHFNKVTFNNAIFIDGKMYRTKPKNIPKS